MGPRWLLVMTALLAACAGGRGRTVGSGAAPVTGASSSDVASVKQAEHGGACPALGPARGPFAHVEPPPATTFPAVWLGPQHDVLLRGQIPVVYVLADEGRGSGYRETGEFELRGPGNEVVPRSCDATRHPHFSRGYAVLNFECQWPSVPGLFSVTLVPARLGLSGAPVQLPLRILKELPKTPPPPAGWVALPLARGQPDDCHNLNFDDYEVRLDSNDVRIAVVAPRPKVPIPAALAPRMSADHGAGVQYVFEDGEGWLVMFDHGEFGGGVEWYAKSGGPPRSIEIGQSPGRAPFDSVPQNVNRAMTAEGVVYVLQGQTHLMTRPGQLAALWREHDHFTSRVVARYRTEPIDWIAQDDGTWLVLTDEAIWHTSRAGEVSLVTRVPAVMQYASSFIRTVDGTFYVSGRSGVVRLTPLWTEHPRYAADWLIPKGSALQKCWASWLADPKRPRWSNPAQ